MKSSKKKIAVSILTVFMMVFTVIPYMGAVNAYAGTYAKVQENTPSVECPVAKVAFTADENSKMFDIDVTVDLDVYPTGDLGFSEAYQLNVYSEDTNNIKALTCGSFDFMYQLDSNGCYTFKNVLNNAKLVEPGENIGVEFILCGDAFGDEPLSNYQWASMTFTAPEWSDGGETEPEAPVTPPEEPDFTPDEDFTKDEEVGPYTYTGDGLVYEFSFKADETKYLKGSGVWYWTSMSDDTNYKSYVYDSSGNLIEGIPQDYNEEILWNFPKADTYTYKLYSGNPYGKMMVYKVKLQLGTSHVYTYKFEPLELEVREQPKARPEDTAKYYVTIREGLYDGDDELDFEIYRQDLATGMFTIPFLVSYRDDETVDYYRDYKYFVVNKNRLSGETLAELPTSPEESVYMKPAAIEELNEVATTGVVSIPAPKLGTVSIVKVTPGIKKVTLRFCADANGSVTGIEVQKKFPNGGFDSIAQFEIKGIPVDKTYVIPYDQNKKTQFRVVPYYDYNGLRYYGAPGAAVSVKSAKVQPASGNVTKLSNGKARVYTIKATGAASTQVQYKLPGKAWTNAKWVTQGATAAKYKKTVAVTNAGKATYRFRSVIKDNGNTYYSAWKVYNPLANQRTYTTNNLAYWRSYDLGQPGPFKVYYQPSKVYYSGNNIKVTGKFFNTSSVNTRTCKVTLTFKDDTGKKIATKTVSCKVAPYSTKTYTFTLAAKKDVNLRNISYTRTYKAQ